MSLRKRILSLRRQPGRSDAKPADPGRKAAPPRPAAERQKEAAERARGAAQRERKGAESAESKSKKSRSRPNLSRPEPKAKRTASATASKRPQFSTYLRKLAGAIIAVLVEAGKLAKEMLAIPLELWLAAAEIAGAVVLKAWLRVVRPLLIALWRFGVASVRFGERHLTPARGVAAVAVVAIGALAASQWLDYRAIRVGTDAYSGSVGAVAPPPQVSSEIAGHAHAWVMVPLAAAALAFLVVAITGRRRAAALLVAVGIVVIAISVGIDAPKGLDEGSAALAYESASASLLEGFWVQIVCGAVLIACGLMLPRYLRPATARASTPTGPSLLASSAAWLKSRSRRPIRRPRLRRHPGAKRKVQGAGT